MKKEKTKRNLFKIWHKTAEPNKLYWTIQIVSYLIYVVFYTIITIFAAKTIDSLYNAEWESAFFYLALELLSIIIRSLAYHIEYVFYGKNHIHIRKVIAKKIYRKVLACDFSKSKDMTKDKLLNIAFNNSGDTATFADAVAMGIGCFVQASITLVIIFMANWAAGLIVLGLGFINAVVYYKFNKTIGELRKKRYEEKDNIFHSYSKVIEGRRVINEYSRQQLYEEIALKNVRNHAKVYGKFYLLSSWRDNMYFVAWNVIIYAITAFLIYLVSNGSLNLEIYLVIVPYLSSGTVSLTELFNKTKYVEEMRVDVDRINLILNMSNQELLHYGEININSPGYNLGLIDVSYKNEDKNSKFFGEISNVDLSFMMNKINVVKGEKGSGKRQIFNILRRYIKPDSGVVLLDNLDLFQYDEKNFKKQINYCSSHPKFIKGTIKENLIIANNKFELIEDLCQKVGVYNAIVSLPNKFDSNIDEIKETGTRFLLGLVRAVLSDCKILMIYEIPDDTPKKFRTQIKRLLQTYQINKTVILFTHSDVYDNIADMIVEIKTGKICNINVNSKKADGNEK